MTLVDSHCHLDDPQFDADREAVIERAHAAGVTTMLAVGTGEGPPDLEAGIRLVEQAARPAGCPLGPAVSPADTVGKTARSTGLLLLATVGVHPHDARKATADIWPRLETLLAHPKVVAVGEIGLDYHYDNSPRDQQRTAFVEQMKIARRARKPVVIHTREAWEDTWRLLEEHWAPSGLGGIMHCFSGGPEEARRALDMGFHLAFGGVVTYPKANRVREAALVTPLDRLLVETDAPYLAPVPMRGRRNEPAFVAETARRLAELRGESVETLADATTANFRRLMGYT